MQFFASLLFLISLYSFVAKCERICKNEKRIKITYARYISLEKEKDPPRLYDAKLCSMKPSQEFNFLETLEKGFGAVTLPKDFIEYVTTKKPSIKDLREKFIELFKLPDDMILIQGHNPVQRTFSQTTPLTHWHIDFPGVSSSEIASDLYYFNLQDVSTDHWDMVHSFNMWFPTHAPFAMPLGFMDPETVSESQRRSDMFASLRPPPRGKKNTIFYVPNMRVGQAYLFDNRKQTHGAFDDQKRGLRGSRSSIDHRFAILKAKSQWALNVAKRGKQQFYSATPEKEAFSGWINKSTGAPIQSPKCKWWEVTKRWRKFKSARNSRASKD